MQNKLSSHRHARPAITAALPAAVAAALLALAATPVHAIGFSQGDATLDINGTVNGFYSHRTEERAGVKTTDSALTRLFVKVG